MAYIESQVHAAKEFLLQASSNSKNNLYDHLSECLSRVLAEQTPNAVDIFESISSSVKKEKLKASDSTVQDQEGPSDRIDLAEKQKGLFQKTDEDAEEEIDDEVSIPFPDLLEVSRCFELGGIGLGREEMIRINLALRQLTRNEPLVSVRFWGKIFGTNANYIIAEAEYQEGEGEEDELEGDEKVEDESTGSQADLQREGSEDLGSEVEKDEPPISQWKPPPVVPKEEPKTGVNKKTYFVCNNPGEAWVKLPHVTPAQIVATRAIKKLFTGNLDAPVVTFPPFPGKEIQYLRAQIARISASTQISPNGFFQSPEEEEEEEEEGGIGVIEPNPEFEVDKISEFADINNWCHHVPFLLPQGRTVWWNPLEKAEDEFEEEEEEEDDEKEQLEEPEPETGPPLLASIAEDAKVDGLPPWVARLSSDIMPQYAVAIASSNLWPGAHAYAAGKKFENLYIGWGMKYSARPFNPTLPPTVQDEFPTGADIAETTDPTVEQERALKAAQEEAEAELDEEEEPDDEESDED